MPYARERIVDARHHQRHFRDCHYLGALRGVPRQGQGRDRERRSAAATGRKTGRSPAASPMSIPTGRRPLSPSTQLGRHGHLIEQWEAIKTAGLGALIGKPAARSRITTPSAAIIVHHRWPVTPTALRRGAQGGEAGGRPAGFAQSGCADRSLAHRAGRKRARAIRRF